MSIETNSEEMQYLDLMRNILDNGYDKPTRTGITARSLTGIQMRFDLTRDGEMVVPLLTTKNTSFRLVLSELLWLLEGKCNANDLAAVNNHIWDANSSREYLDKIGLQHHAVGDLGPVYGVQWRHWNRTTGPGIDQIQQVIESIRRDPYGRRHIVTAWNPEQLPDMALAPCHYCFQFVVRPQKHNQTPYWIDCILNQRSADVPLGIPYNMASYAILTHMIASLTGLHAGTLFHNMGDVHIYHNQFDGCYIQLERVPKKFPTMRFKSVINHIDDFKFADFELLDYHPAATIKFPFAT